MCKGIGENTVLYTYYSEHAVGVLRRQGHAGPQSRETEMGKKSVWLDTRLLLLSLSLAVNVHSVVLIPLKYC